MLSTVGLPILGDKESYVHYLKIMKLTKECNEITIHKICHKPGRNDPRGKY